MVGSVCVDYGWDSLRIVVGMRFCVVFLDVMKGEFGFGIVVDGLLDGDVVVVVEGSLVFVRVVGFFVFV